MVDSGPSNETAPPAALLEDPVPADSVRRTRTRTGCLNCRRKKRKCDESRPSCGACHRRGNTCEWGIKVSFRAEHAQHLDKTHPSMRRMEGKRPREFEILDVTSEIVRDYNVSSSIMEVGGASETRRSSSALVDSVESPGPLAPLEDSNLKSRAGEKSCTADKSADKSPYLLASVSTTDPGSNQQDSNAALQPSMLTGTASSAPIRHAESAVANLIYLSQGGELLSSRDQTEVPLDSMRLQLPSTYMNSIEGLASEASSIDDGIFLPGSAYHEWHSALRSHLIQEVKSNVPTRSGTPHRHLEADQYDTDSNLHDFNFRNILLPDGMSSPDNAFPLISKMEECALWRNWFDEISPWLDKFDNQRHFQHIIPTMAAKYDHLRYSLLALSARQIELKQTTLAANKSLALYQESIHLLLPHLPERSTAVIASCLILCVFEMLSCSPKAWQRHLDGCASLLEAVGINGFVGEVEQALFWCFARMDVCGGLISSVKTLIPVSHWASKTDLATDVKMFEALADFSGWANYAVYLMAQVLDLLMPSSQTKLETPALASLNFRARWIQLWQYICEWHEGRSPPLHPTLTIPSSDSSPFPTILFSNPAAISGNQLYHTASLLMLQNRPPGLDPVPKPRSVLWHARRICAISLSNDHHGAWTNALQPLWIAGRCMSNPTEHRVILDLLERIEKESGWGTRWRADDLKAFWGDLGDC